MWEKNLLCWARNSLGHFALLCSQFILCAVNREFLNGDWFVHCLIWAITFIICTSVLLDVHVKPLWFRPGHDLPFAVAVIISTECCFSIPVLLFSLQGVGCCCLLCSLTFYFLTLLFSSVCPESIFKQNVKLKDFVTFRWKVGFDEGDNDLNLWASGSSGVAALCMNTSGKTAWELPVLWEFEWFKDVYHLLRPNKMALKRPVEELLWWCCDKRAFDFEDLSGNLQKLTFPWDTGIEGTFKTK